MPLPTATASTSVVFLLVLILAFFPNLFITILSLPFAPLFPSKPLAPILPTCDCCPAAHCFPAAGAPQLFPSAPSGSSSTTTTTTIPASAPVPPPPSMSWTQKTFSLPSKSKGSYLVTDHVLQNVPEIRNYKVGLLNLFVQHTSCALSLNENWDEDVRDDMTDALDRVAPEDTKGNLYRHSAEGLDDMPAHIKSALVGASVTIPIKDGKLATGTWQGIWYLEFRAYKHTRKVVATIQGEKS